MEGFKLEMEQELQTLRFELEDEGKAMLGTLSSNLQMGPKTTFLLIQVYMCVHTYTNTHTYVYCNTVVYLGVVQI